MKKRILKGLGLGLVIVFLFGFEVIRAEGDLEKYICRNINTSIKIDGHLNDCAWNKAGKVYLNVINCPASRQTTWFKLLWDKKYLYVGFHCKDTDIWSSQKRRDADLYIEEVVEIFLDPDSDGKTYIELEVNPRNAVLDFFVIRGTFQRWSLPLREWNALGIRTMVKISGTLNERRDKDNYWEIEIAIPLTNFATAPNTPPKNGDCWRMNLFRIDRNFGCDPEFSAWTKLEKVRFHQPDKFGKLIFSDTQAELNR